MAILYEPSEPRARQIVPLLPPGVAVVAVPAALVRRVTTDPSEVLVVFGPGTALSEAAAFLRQCRTHRPRLGVVLLRGHVEEHVLAEARRAGVSDVVRADDGAGIAAACARALHRANQFIADQPGQPGQAGQPVAGPPPPPAQPVVLPGPVNGSARRPDPAPAPAATDPAPSARPEGGGRVIVVFGGKGGAGKSVIATNLAVALADRRSRVCLIDLDLAFGDVGILLQLAPDRTLAHAIGLAERLDQTGLRTLLTPYRDNVDVLLAPVAPAEAEQVGRGLVETVIALARSAFDIVVVDCASQFSEPVLAALDAAHFHVLVTTPELTALKGMRVTLDMFDLLDYGRDGRLIVLNRADTKVGLSTADAEKVLRASITAHVPSSREVPVSVNRGVPIVEARPKHAVSAAIRALAGRFATATDAGAPRGLRRLIRRGGEPAPAEPGGEGDSR